jgi:primosomal protein N'
MIALSCRMCGHEHEVESLPDRCPYCGSLNSPPVPPKTEAELEAELEADTLAAKFELAAKRAKGNF